jgi:hypothetical protein
MSAGAWTARCALLAASLLVVWAALAQRGGFRRGGGDRWDELEPVRPGEFHFIRLEYADLPQYHRRFGYSSREGVGTGWWLMDWPAADNHFTAGIRRLTRIDAGDPRHLGLLDPKLFDYPFIYATQTGWWGLSDAEVSRLREYLDRGGFLMTDDFWGPEQWEIFRRTMERVFPRRAILDIDERDAVNHVLYDIRAKDRTIIPGSRHLRQGADGAIRLVYPEGSVPAWRAIVDEKSRLVVAINFNTDIGDAWEFADAPYYPEAMSSLAYRYGINYLVYSMTH